MRSFGQAQFLPPSWNDIFYNPTLSWSLYIFAKLKKNYIENYQMNDQRQKIFHECLCKLLNHIREYEHHASLKSDQCITQIEWHFSIRKSSIWASECRLSWSSGLMAIWLYLELHGQQPSQHLINEGQGNAIFKSDIIESFIVYAPSNSWLFLFGWAHYCCSPPWISLPLLELLQLGLPIHCLR